MYAALVTLLALAAPLPAEDVARQAEADFENGVAARGRGERSRAHFLAAARGFEELRRRGANNPVLERNLGNAYLLADDLPRAILAYRRGLRLAPTDRHLRANLREARRQVIILEGSTLGRPPELLHPPWLPHMPRGLFALAVVGYAGCWVGLTRWLMLRRKRALTFALAALAAGAAATLLLVLTWRAQPARPVVVIAENGVQLRKGNGRSFPPRYDVPLNRGVEAELLYRLDGWLQVELSGGEVGWVAESEAVVEE